jgi:HAD superfamily hydrolase (TIGR01509 family)
MKTILVDARKVLITQDGLYQPLYDLLETYPNPKIVLTNANPQQQEQLGLNKQPYPLFTLNHQPEKTDPKYYETILHHYNITIDEVIYFENDLSSVESARSVGIITYHYNPETKDLVALKKFLDNNL